MTLWYTKSSTIISSYNNIRRIMDRIRYSYENMNIIKLDYISNRNREKIFYKKVNIFARFWIEET